MPVGKVKYTNNAYGHLTQAVTPGNTTLQMDDASLFPALGQNDWAFVSLDMEVVRVIDIDPAAHTITLDPSFPVQGPHPMGTIVELRMCRELLDSLGDMGEY